MLIMGFELLAACCGLRVSRCGLCVAGREARVAGFRLPVSSFAIQVIMEFDELIVRINPSSNQPNQLNQPVNLINQST